MSSVMTPPAGTTGARAVGPPDPDAGSGPARTALLLLAAAPVAVVALVLWELGVQTSAGYNPSERVRGWSAVLRELPALVLLFAPVVLGLGLGVRAARLGARPGRAAIWLHAGALLLLLAIALAGVAEDVMTTDATVTTRLLLALGAGVAGAVLLLCLRAGHRRPAGAPARSRHRLAALVVAAGTTGSLAWLIAAQATLSAEAGDLPRAHVPGEITVAVNRADTYFVYAEGNAPDDLSELRPEVTDPSGSPVAVRAVAPRAAYLHDGRGGRATAAFEAVRTGDYTVATGAGLAEVTAPFAPENPNGDFAVGESLDGWMRPHERGAAALVLVSLAGGIGVAVTARRRAQA